MRKFVKLTEVDIVDGEPRGPVFIAVDTVTSAGVASLAIGGGKCGFVCVEQARYYYVQEPPEAIMNRMREAY